MIFNGDSDDQDICSAADDYVKTDDVDFPLKRKARYANQVVREIFGWILSVYGGWIMDDSNNSTTVPSATTDLNSGQAIYALPTEMMDLIGMSYKLENDLSWEPLKPITVEMIKDMGYAEPEFERIPGNPIYYRPVGNAVKLYPAPNFTQAASLQADFTRDIVPFTSSSTTQQPGFPSLFHEAVPTGMAMMYAEVETLDVANSLRKAWDGNEEVTKVEGGWKKKIKSHFQSRFREMFPGTMKHKRDIVSDYIS